jgi:hypothetical protein
MTMNRTLTITVVLLVLIAMLAGGLIYRANASEQDVEVEETTVEAGERTYVEVEDPKPVWERYGMTEAEYEQWAQEVNNARQGNTQEIQSKIEQDMQAGGKLDQAKQRKEAFDARHGG